MSCEREGDRDFLCIKHWNFKRLYQSFLEDASRKSNKKCFTIVLQDEAYSKSFRIQQIFGIIYGTSFAFINILHLETARVVFQLLAKYPRDRKLWGSFKNVLIAWIVSSSILTESFDSMSKVFKRGNFLSTSLKDINSNPGHSNKFLNVQREILQQNTFLQVSGCVLCK